MPAPRGYDACGAFTIGWLGLGTRAMRRSNVPLREVR